MSKTQEIIQDVRNLNWQLKGGVKKDPSSYVQKIAQIDEQVKSSISLKGIVTERAG